jgi:hypothetical protein
LSSSLNTNDKCEITLIVQLYQEKTSPFGVFLRKMQYAFNQMGIEGLATLFKQFKLYSNDILLIQKEKDNLEHPHEENEQDSIEMNNTFNDLYVLDFASSDEVALFLANEAQQIESSFI